MNEFNNVPLFNWEQWKVYHARNLEHPADYERKFVDAVIRHLHNVEPMDVIPQYHFTDSRGGNRYIDFVILNPAKGYSLAIELDGLTKIQNQHNNSLNYDRYNDMMLRQNDLLKLANVESLLRFTNKQAFNHTAWVINEINQELQKQAYHATLLLEQQSRKMEELQAYQSQILQLKQENDALKRLKEDVKIQEVKETVETQKTTEAVALSQAPLSVPKPVPVMPTVTDDIMAERYKEEAKAKRKASFKRLLRIGLILVVVVYSGWHYLGYGNTDDVGSSTKTDTSYSSSSYSSDYYAYTPTDAAMILDSDDGSDEQGLILTDATQSNDLKDTIITDLEVIARSTRDSSHHEQHRQNVESVKNNEPEAVSSVHSSTLMPSGMFQYEVSRLQNNTARTKREHKTKQDIIDEPVKDSSDGIQETKEVLHHRPSKHTVTDNVIDTQRGVRELVDERQDRE